MKREKLFLTFTEICYLKEVIPNNLNDFLNEKDLQSVFTSKKQVKAFLAKIEAL